MPLWIPITIFAALCQNIRTTMQQKIRGVLSVDGANFVRYLYGAPLALGMLAFLVFVTGRHVPSISLYFGLTRRIEPGKPASRRFRSTVRPSAPSR